MAEEGAHQATKRQRKLKLCKDWESLDPQNNTLEKWRSLERSEQIQQSEECQKERKSLYPKGDRKRKWVAEGKNMDEWRNLTLAAMRDQTQRLDTLVSSAKSSRANAEGPPRPRGRPKGSKSKERGAAATSLSEARDAFYNTAKVRKLLRDAAFLQQELNTAETVDDANSCAQIAVVVSWKGGKRGDANGGRVKSGDTEILHVFAQSEAAFEGVVKIAEENRRGPRAGGDGAAAAAAAAAGGDANAKWPVLLSSSADVEETFMKRKRAGGRPKSTDDSEDRVVVAVPPDADLTSHVI